jgi:hypothetical protein
MRLGLWRWHCNACCREQLLWVVLMSVCTFSSWVWILRTYQACAGLQPSSCVAVDSVGWG